MSTIDNPIEDLMKCTMESLKSMVDVNTVVGETVQTSDGNYIIPISKVSFGFASGGSQFPDKKSAENLTSKYPFGGGSGAGVSVKPVAFLVVKQGTVRLLPVEHDTTYDKIIDSVPVVIDTLKDLMKKNAKESENQNQTKMDSVDTSCNLKK